MGAGRQSSPATGLPWPPVSVSRSFHWKVPIVWLSVMSTTVDDSGGVVVAGGGGGGGGTVGGDGALGGGASEPPPPPQPQSMLRSTATGIPFCKLDKSFMGIVPAVVCWLTGVE